MSSTRSGKPWTPFQDVLLAQAAVNHDKQWIVIGESLGRHPQECASRYTTLLDKGLPRVSPRKKSPKKNRIIDQNPPKKLELVKKPKSKRVLRPVQTLSSPIRRKPKKKQTLLLTEPSEADPIMNPIDLEGLFGISGQVGFSSLTHSHSNQFNSTQAHSNQIIQAHSNQIIQAHSNQFNSNQFHDLNSYSKQDLDSQLDDFFSSPKRDTAIDQFMQHDQEQVTMQSIEDFFNIKEYASSTSGLNTTSTATTNGLSSTAMNTNTLNTNGLNTMTSTLNKTDNSNGNEKEADPIELLNWNLEQPELVPPLLSTTSPTVFLDMPVESNAGAQPVQHVDLDDLFSFPDPKPEDVMSVPTSPAMGDQELGGIWDDCHVTEDDGDLFGAAAFIPDRAMSSPASIHSDDDSDDDGKPEDISRAEVDDLFMENLLSIPERQRVGLDLVGSSTPIHWVNESKKTFSWQQIVKIQEQLTQAVQLCIQSYAVACEVKGATHTEGLYWKAQLANHFQVRDFAVRSWNERSMYNIPIIDRIPLILNVTFNHSSKESLMFRTEWNSSMKPFAKDRTLAACEKSKTTPPYLTLTPSIKEIVDICSGFSKAELLPRIISISRVNRFLEIEDQLLTLGLIKFGQYDLASIRAYFLPVKSCTQITTRISNLNYVRKAEHPVKDFLLQPFKPLNETEKQLLYWGIKVLGPQFKQLAQNIFNYTADALIKMTWDDMYRIGRIKYSWDEIEPIPQHVLDAYVPPIVDEPIIISENQRIAPKPIHILPATSNVHTISDKPLDVPKRSKRKSQPRPLAPPISSDFGYHGSELSEADTHVVIDVPMEPMDIIPSPVANPDMDILNTWNSDFETDFEMAPPSGPTEIPASERPMISLSGAYKWDSSDEEGDKHDEPLDLPDVAMDDFSVAKSPAVLDFSVAKSPAVLDDFATVESPVDMNFSVAKSPVDMNFSVAKSPAATNNVSNQVIDNFSAIKSQIMKDTPVSNQVMNDITTANQNTGFPMAFEESRDIVPSISRGTGRAGTKRKRLKKPDTTSTLFIARNVGKGRCEKKRRK